MRILDRYIIRNFLLNYLLALVVLVGMYVLLDLIVNLDRFIKGAKIANQAGVLPLLGDIADFYGYQVLVMFQQVASVIPILAAAFTMVRMSRHNELTAMLASGVSLYRVALPIVLLSIAFSLLAVIDQELIMPQVQDKLMRKHDEVNRTVRLQNEKYMIMPDHNNRIIFSTYDTSTKRMNNVWILWRDKDGHVLRNVMADTAEWTTDPKELGANGGGGSGVEGLWKLSGHARWANEVAEANPGQNLQSAVVRDKLYYSSGLLPQHVELFLSKKAVDFLSLNQVLALINNSTDNTKPTLQKMIHTRVTQPIMNVIMLLLGIPFLLTRDPRMLVRNIVYCLFVCAVCFAATFVCYQMGGTVIPPLLAAWLPVLIFGPLSLAMLDTIKT